MFFFLSFFNAKYVPITWMLNILRCFCVFVWKINFRVASIVMAAKCHFHVIIISSNVRCTSNDSIVVHRNICDPQKIFLSSASSPYELSFYLWQSSRVHFSIEEKKKFITKKIIYVACSFNACCMWIFHFMRIIVIWIHAKVYECNKANSEFHL